MTTQDVSQDGHHELRTARQVAALDRTGDRAGSIGMVLVVAGVALLILAY